MKERNILNCLIPLNFPGADDDCKLILDICFIMDSSGSLAREYHKEKQFLNAVIDNLNLGENEVRAGVITFSYYVELSIKLNQFYRREDFKKKVTSIPLMRSTTRIDKALRMVQNEFFSVSNGARPGIPKLVILMTDGTQSKGRDVVDPGDIADEIRSAGIPVVVIGIGKGINAKELEHISGGPDTLFMAQSFDELISGGFIKTFMSGKCKAGKDFRLKCLKHTKTSTTFSTTRGTFY